MTNVHDLGGKPGFGKIPYISDEREYKERWEFVLMSITRLAYAKELFRADALRYSIERIFPENYLADPYYGRMLAGVTNLSIEARHISLDDLKRHAGPHVVFPEINLPQPGHAGLTSDNDRHFSVGDKVIVRTKFSDGHVRTPSYVTGKVGTLVRKGRRLPFPGQAGHMEPYQLERTWLVEFDCSTIWDEGTDSGTITVDLWESYFEPAAPVAT